MHTNKNEEVIAIWGYTALNGYDGFDWIDVDSCAVLCEDSNKIIHLYLECNYDSQNQKVLNTSFEVGFNPIFNVIGLDNCIEDVLNEYCMFLELELYDKNNYEDYLDELELWEVKSNILRHMRSVISNETDYWIHDFPSDEGIPFRVWVSRIY